MVVDDTVAREILEEDRQTEAMLKEFAKGNYVPHLQDSAANQRAIKNMMSSGRSVNRASAVKGN
jgi:hypothetical protein